MEGGGDVYVGEDVVFKMVVLGKSVECLDFLRGLGVGHYIYVFKLKDELWCQTLVVFFDDGVIRMKSEVYRKGSDARCVGDSGVRWCDKNILGEILKSVRQEKKSII